MDLPHQGMDILHQALMDILHQDLMVLLQVHPWAILAHQDHQDLQVPQRQRQVIEMVTEIETARAIVVMTAGVEEAVSVLPAESQGTWRKTALRKGSRASERCVETFAVAIALVVTSAAFLTFERRFQESFFVACCCEFHEQGLLVKPSFVIHKMNLLI